MFHIGASMMAGEYKDWNKIAIVSGEIALGFDLIIEPLFWKEIAPSVFPDMGWSGLDLYWRVEMPFVHSIPIIAMFINIGITDMVFLKKDWRMCFVAGILYIGADYLGFRMEGHPMYPVVDWSNPKVTIGIFMA